LQSLARSSLSSMVQGLKLTLPFLSIALPPSPLSGCNFVPVYPFIPKLSIYFYIYLLHTENSPAAHGCLGEFPVGVFGGI
jgi:hypothetical protein